MTGVVRRYAGLTRLESKGKDKDCTIAPRLVPGVEEEPAQGFGPTPVKDMYSVVEEVVCYVMCGIMSRK